MKDMEGRKTRRPSAIEALARDPTSQWLIEGMEAMPLSRLEALHRVAKTRCRAFFANPTAMKALRELIAERKENMQ